MHLKLAADYNEIATPEAFLEEILGSEQGLCKKASATAERMIRRRLRENSFTEAILPAETITDADLDRNLDTEFPMTIEEMEPDSPGARTIPFSDTADTYFPFGEKFAVYFSEQATPEFAKNVYLLKGYKTDIRQVVTDNALKDLQTEIDFRFIRTVDRIVGAVGQNGEAGIPQNFETDGFITRESYVAVKNDLEDRDLNVGINLINRKTANEFLKWGHDETGGTLSQEMLQDGTRAVQKFKWFAMEHALTIKKNLVPDGAVYSFAPPNYLGKHYVYQPVTMYMKRDQDIIRWKAVTKTGLTLANTAAVSKRTFDI